MTKNNLYELKLSKNQIQELFDLLTCILARYGAANNIKMDKIPQYKITSYWRTHIQLKELLIQIEAEDKL